jgi:hypothetical protein
MGYGYVSFLTSCFWLFWVEDYLLHWSFFSLSLLCLTLLLGVLRVNAHTTVVFDYHKSSDNSLHTFWVGPSSTRAVGSAKSI